MSFGDDAFRLHTPMLIDFDVLRDEYDGSWRRDESCSEAIDAGPTTQTSMLRSRNASGTPRNDG